MLFKCWNKKKKVFSRAVDDFMHDDIKASLYMSKHIIYERCWCYNVLLHGVLSRTEADAFREAEILRSASDYGKKRKKNGDRWTERESH